MWGEWFRAILDIVLIGLVSAGLVQATRLLGHLAGLRASRTEMERFVHEFGATVMRAEKGIRNLKQAARESGDDLEKLVEKSFMVRDELQFIVESADQLAERLTKAASDTVRPRRHPAPEASKNPPPKPRQTGAGTHPKSPAVDALSIFRPQGTDLPCGKRADAGIEKAELDHDPSLPYQPTCCFSIYDGCRRACSGSAPQRYLGNRFIGETFGIDSPR